MKTIETNPQLEIPFEQLIVNGGDERLDLGSNGLNKYNVQVTDYKDVFNRASCTCSPFTPDGYKVAKELYSQLDEQTFSKTRSEHTRIIKDLINHDGQDQFDVFYAPSGSDLCYLPLLFSRLIDPKNKVLNLTTCPEELGSGSVSAYSGDFYFSRNQMGDLVEKGTPIAPKIEIESLSFAARSTDGQVLDHWPEILKHIHDRYHTHSINANLVIGSKSGIENNVAIVSQAPEKVLWTIDLCQFRASRKLINGLIGMNCLVMITGSKFYQSPPFCAVLLVPKTITRQFGEPTAEIASPFGKVFSRYDIPEKFETLRSYLPDYCNYGLLLRWQAALTEMQAFAKLDSFEVNDVILRWNQDTKKKLSGKGCFMLMPDEDLTNKTIVSFRVRKRSGEFFSHEQLVELYRTVCSQNDLEIGRYSRVLFGQPVKYGDRSFIRLALGASDVRHFVSHGLNMDNDFKLIDILQHFVEQQA